MRIVVIEPHPDDAMLNVWGIMHELMDGQKANVFLLTMTAQQEDPRALLEPHFGSRFIQLNMGHIGINWTLKGRRGYAEKYGPDWNTPETLRRIFRDQNEGLDWSTAVTEAIDAAGNADIWLMPVGQIHPMHIMVREEFGKQLAALDVLLYKEYPYCTRVRGTTFDQMVERLGLEEANKFYNTDEGLEAKCLAIKQFYPLGHLYMIQFPHAQEALRLEEVFSCQTTVS